MPVSFTPADAAQLNIKNPRLWWPNGYGLPSLYNATIKVIDAKGVEEIRQFRFGIREYAYEMMADTDTKQAVRFAYSPTDIKVDKPIR